jgi:hypothetical protein
VSGATGPEQDNVLRDIIQALWTCFVRAPGLLYVLLDFTPLSRVLLPFKASRIRGRRQRCKYGSIFDSCCTVIRTPVNGVVKFLMLKPMLSCSMAASRSKLSNAAEVQSTNLCVS